MPASYYVPSGRLPWRVLPLTLACAAIVTIPAWLYAWVTIEAPLVLVDWFALFVFALLLGLAMSAVVRLGKARNPVWIGRLGLGVAMVGWYAQWAAWVAITRQAADSAGASVIDFVVLLGDPLQVYRSAMALSDLQAPSLAGVELNGGVLVAAWIVELIVLLAATRLIGLLAAEDPFCELTETWAEKMVVPRKFAYIPFPDELIARLERNPKQLLSILDINPDEAPELFAVVTLYRTGGDPYVSIDNVTIKRNGTSESKRTRSVISYLRMPGADADDIFLSAGEDGQSAPNPPELLRAIAHLEVGRFEAARAAAVPYTTQFHENLRVDALRLRALACARLERWDDSRDYWERLFDADPTAFNAAQVGATYAMAGDAAQGEEWIADARLLNSYSDDMADVEIVTNFISALSQSGHMTQALPYLEELRALYTSVQMTDSTFLYLRKIPFFCVFLDNSLPVIQAALSPEEGRAWYVAMLSSLDQEGQDAVNQWIEAHVASATAS